MKHLALVCLGGAFGSALRYGADQLLLRMAAKLAVSFPLATLAVNLVGCFAAGLLFGLVTREGFKYGPDLKVLLITGLCGGLTTFSAFALQTVNTSPAKAGANISVSVAGGLLLAWVGLAITSGSSD